MIGRLWRAFQRRLDVRHFIWPEIDRGATGPRHALRAKAMHAAIDPAWRFRTEWAAQYPDVAAEVAILFDEWYRAAGEIRSESE